MKNTKSLITRPAAAGAYLLIVIIMLLSLSPATLSTVNKAHAQTRILSNDPVGVFQGTGSAAVYYPGTGGINSTSFASSSYYSLAGQNTTYTYTVSNIPSGNFSLRIPLGQAVLNITTPTSTALSSTDYTITPLPTANLINIPNSTGTRYMIGGTYNFYTTSINGVSGIYAQDATSLHILNFTNPLDPGQRVDLVEISIDPFRNALANASSTISLWSNNGTMLNSWTGLSDNTGFYRAHNIPLPLFNGGYTLQATSNSSANAGIRTRQFSILIAHTCCDTLTTTITIIAVVAAAIGLTLFYLTRKRRTRALSKKPPTSRSIRRNKGEAPKKSR